MGSSESEGRVLAGIEEGRERRDARMPTPELTISATASAAARTSGNCATATVVGSSGVSRSVTSAANRGEEEGRVSSRLDGKEGRRAGTCLL